MPSAILDSDTQFNAQPNMQNQNNPYSISFGWPSLLEDVSGGSSHIVSPFSYPNVDVQVPWQTIDLHTQQIGKLLQEFQRRGKEISIDLLPSLKLTKPIHPTLSYDQEADLYMVEYEDLGIYGASQDETEAVEDFRSAFEEYYRNLKKDRERLGPRLQKTLQYFEQIVSGE